jgi:glycosyltransferase involved in cell wall biosynthesis
VILPEEPNGGAPQVELTVLLPCLNEARTVATCVRKAIEVCTAHGVAVEVLVADNGSTDGSPGLSLEAGATVLPVAAPGYGAALRAGIGAARGRFVIMGDADDSYEFGDIPIFLDELRKGAELVMGSRFRGTIHPGAMPLLHRFLGNPVLTFILNLFFGAGVSDAHCGMRGLDRKAIQRLALRCNGMEFASEMIIRAAQEKLRIREVPTSLRPDGRGRRPHLRTWRDGWRHLRFMLLFSPLWLFLIPGLSAAATGLALMAAVAFTNVALFGHRLNTHFALLGSALAILGIELSILGAFAKAVFVLDGIGKSAGARRLLDGFDLEKALLAGLTVLLAGAGMDGTVLLRWLRSHGGALDANATHLAILGGTLCVVAVQVIFSAFFLSILKSSRTGRWV